MIEAYIMCLTAQHDIEDLGLRLRKGESLWLDASRARKSQDLKLASTVGAIKLMWLERSTTTKTPVAVIRPVPVPVKPTVPATPKMAKPLRTVEEPAPITKTSRRTKK